MKILLMEPSNPPKGWRKKMGYFGWDKDELLFHPSQIGMSEGEATLSCLYDGSKVVEINGAILISEKFARQEKPHLNKAIDTIRKFALNHKEH